MTGPGPDADSGALAAFDAYTRRVVGWARSEPRAQVDVGARVDVSAEQVDDSAEIDLEGLAHSSILASDISTDLGPS